MHETATAHLHFDWPSPDQPLQASGEVVRGWLVPKPGNHYTDLRIINGSHIFTGIYGFPRADLAAHFGSTQPYLLAEFAIPVRLECGRTTLVLEGYSIQGRWESISPLTVEVVVADRPLTEIEPRPIRAHEVGAAMRNLLRRLGPGEITPEAAVAALLDKTAYPHVLRLPHLPFHGNLDEPWSWSETVFGRLTVLGCLFHESQPIKRIFATADLQAVQNLTIGRASAPYGSHYPDFPQAQACEFAGIIDVPAQLHHPVPIRVYAELLDGSWHLGSVVRTTATDHEFSKQPLPPYTLLTFWRIWRQWKKAATARGYRLETGRPLWRELCKVWSDYRTQAPRRRPHQTPRIAPAKTKRAIEHLHLVTHNLNQEGAPLFLVEYARHRQQTTGCKISVTSGQEGSLRQAYEAIGATVEIVNLAPLFAATTAAGLRRAIHQLGVGSDLSAADLVVANTLSAYWGVHLAMAAGRPTLLYIHESTSPAAFFRGHMHPATLPIVEETFARATAVSFLTATTQRYYTALSDGTNYRLNPGWIDLAAIDEFRRTHQREPSRIELGRALERRLVINIGTVCDRKAQHIFARAVDLLWRNAPELAAQTDFLMVGGRATPYDYALRDFLTTLGRPNLQIIGETANVYPYYAAADLFVCSSYEESFPRVVLEAMAFALPIVSTAVHGVPEITRPEIEAVLVPPGDTAALAEAMQRQLSDPVAAQKMARAARTRVAAEFDAQILLPRHAALADKIATLHD